MINMLNSVANWKLVSFLWLIFEPSGEFKIFSFQFSKNRYLENINNFQLSMIPIEVIWEATMKFFYRMWNMVDIQFFPSQTMVFTVPSSEMLEHANMVTEWSFVFMRLECLLQ